jgi:multisubunit Na+/H+ antiporter MnhC subunit
VSYLRATRVLCWLLGVAVLVSVVHYVDNYVNYDDYPVPGPDAAVPAPSAELVAVGWFLFTAFGVAGLLLWLRRHITSAAVALTGYSLSGLVGIAHYTVPGAGDMVWWRQAHVLTDIVCGAAVLGFALWAARNSSELIPPAAREPRRGA